MRKKTTNENNKKLKKLNEKSNGGNSFLTRLKCLKEKNTLRPLILVMLFIFFSLVAHTVPVSFYVLNVLRDLGVENPASTMFYANIIGLSGHVYSVSMVRRFGKRVTGLISISASCTISLCLGVLIHIHQTIVKIPPIIWSIVFIVRATAAWTGLFVIPQLMTGEVFPMETRGIAIGLYDVAYNLTKALLFKIFYNLEEMLTLPGTIICHGLIGVVGIIYLYIYLPETDRKTLAQVKEMFSSDERKDHFYKLPKSKLSNAEQNI